MGRRLLETIELQQLGCELGGSSLYGDVLAAVADDVAAGGPLADLLAPYAAAPPADAILLRLLAAVHDLVLTGRAPDLARHYPSAGGRPGPGLGEAFLAAVTADPEHCRRGLGGPVQTNEPGRSAALLGGYLEAARPGPALRILELGASGGLNLRFDRYRYTDDGGGFGPVDSPLCIDRPWSGPFRPPLGTPMEVVERAGCDRNPVDPTTEQGRARLRSFVWPDQLDRLARLDAALAVAGSLPVAVERADAVGWLESRLTELPEDTTTVVSHSIFLQYLRAPERRALVAAIEAAGNRATDRRRLAWLRLEPGGDVAELRLTEWPGARPRLLASSAYHGPPVWWRTP